MESKLRSFAKTLSWKLIGVGVGTLVAYFFIGNVATSFYLAASANGITFLLYFIHERIWNKIEWNRDNDSDRATYRDGF